MPGTGRRARSRRPCCAASFSARRHPGRIQVKAEKSRSLTVGTARWRWLVHSEDMQGAMAGRCGFVAGYGGSAGTKKPYDLRSIRHEEGGSPLSVKQIATAYAVGLGHAVADAQTTGSTGVHRPHPEHRRRALDRYRAHRRRKRPMRPRTCDHARRRGSTRRTSGVTCVVPAPRKAMPAPPRRRSRRRPPCGCG
jgi:hypothetical protein